MFDHCPYLNTTALACSVECERTVVYAPFSLTSPQGFVLRVVLKRPGVLNRELAGVLGIARPTVTCPVDGLIAKGLVERQPPAEDGREWNLFLTEAARKLEIMSQATSSKVTRRSREYVGASAFDDTVQTIRDAWSMLNT